MTEQRPTPPAVGRRRDGNVLVYVVLGMVLMGILGIGLIQLATTARQTQLTNASTAQARFYAEAGLDYARHRHCLTAFADGESLTLYPAANAQVTVTRAADTFTATAQFAANSALAASAQAWAPVPVCDEGPPPVVGEQPSDYVVFTGGGPGNSPFRSGDSGLIVGSVYSTRVDLRENVQITENLVADQEVKLRSGVTIGGYVCAKNGEVRLFSSGTTINGNVYAFGDVRLDSGTEVKGSIYATGNVLLQYSNARVGGDIHASGDVELRQAVVAGSVFAGVDIKAVDGATVSGDIHAGRDVDLTWTVEIFGNVYAGRNYKDKSSTVVHGVVLTDADKPPLQDPQPPDGCPPSPPNPQLQTFTPGTTDITISQSTSLELAPGVYRDLNARGGTTLTLTAGSCTAIGQPGCYVFNSWDQSLWGQTLRLDFSAGPASTIAVFIAGSMSYAPVIEVSFDGTSWSRIRDLDEATARDLARRVYWEVHDSFQMNNEGQSPSAEWLGTLLSVNRTRLPDNIYTVGAFASTDGEVVFADSSPIVIYVIADFAVANW